ncbi:4-phosphoerythronate dehydrogenase [Alcanivorax sp. DP30]|uniref:4-phosphoerythronate dehydrogenase n=1 Tax=Alcanivorax sp. DP30 TaxID=2606217 RepID=UPI00136F956D|nr:4-phosphoerythronate dehydrogenase [Alcanivorax sp. DP30]MZR61644.1 DUF3410 domain-containing protein [Alcanivorax sp. DP30]
MKIIADANMPGLEVFARHGEVVTVEGRHINQDTVAEADALLVRSVTRVNASLLAKSPVRFIGSATIGTDHVDRQWLVDTGRVFAHAPGCNARAVAEYVLQALLWVCQQQGKSAASLSAGVVGMGNVGRRVARWLSALGLTVRACDPPLAELGEDVGYTLESISDVLSCDVVTLHVPLSDTGRYPTRHLLDQERLVAMGAEKILINTCRGPVVDNVALEQLLAEGSGPATVLDVWENEPHVPASLLDRVVLGSPHIAGYSLQGKENGTAMVYEAFCRWLGATPQVSDNPGTLPVLEQNVASEADLLALLQQAYPLPEDHRRLRASLAATDPAAAFDLLRKEYPLRQELHRWNWQGSASEPYQKILSALFERA